MWSVWSECVDLYLGQGTALFQVKHQKVQILRYPATLPLAQVMDRLTQGLTQYSAAHKLKRRSLHITLSGALCPAIGFSFPPEVARWHELRQIAQASAAASLASPAEKIVCETDAHRPGIAAAMAAPLMAELQRWANAQNCRIASIRPLWTVATQNQEVSRSSISGLLMQEPDSVTVVADDSNGKIIASTLVGEHEPAAGNVNVRRWLVGLGLSEDRLLKLSFSMREGAVMPNGPKAWAAHWTDHRSTP